MYWNEGRHARPHFHARYGSRAASIDLDGEVIAGALPGRALSLVTECVRSRFSRSTRSRSTGPVEQLVDITAVEVIGEYRLRLTFADGTVGDVDFAGRAWRGVFEPLADPSYFARVTVDPDAGTIAWPDGLDMAPEPLYEQARRQLAHAAHARG
jgi:hypothetical protein